MAMIDLGGAKPVDADSISEVYSVGYIEIYNQRTGRYAERKLKTIQAWELVEALGGSDVFASYVINAERDAVVWLRRSLIRGVVEGIPTKGPGPWSIVQMVYHLPIADPYRVIGDSAPDGAFYTDLTVAETWEVLNARGPVIRPTRPARPPKPLPDSASAGRALKSTKALSGVSERILSVVRPQAHFVQAGDPAAATAYLLDIEGQKHPKLLAVVDLAGLDPALGLPPRGSLSFYHDGGSRTWGDKAAHAKHFSAVHSESPGDVVIAGKEGLVPMTVVTGVGLPPIDSTDGEAIGFETEKQEDAYVDLLAKLFGEPGFPGGVPGTWLGGYPYQLQDDMQEQCAEMAAKAWGLVSEPQEWRLLFQLASESDANMSWGEDGFLYYWIRETDLVQCDFSHVWCILQTM